MPLQLSNEQQEIYNTWFDDDFGIDEGDRAVFAHEFSDFVRRSPHIAPDEADVILQVARDHVENPRGYTMH